MMPIYEQPALQMLLLLDEVKRLYHGRLNDHEVRVDLLVAKAKEDKNGDATGPALRLHGYQANAIVRITSYKDRVLGRGDAEIVVDGDMWHLWSRDQQMALLDHEMEHIEVIVKDVMNDAGMLTTELQRDDASRPKLRLKKHDFQVGWFDSVARRHGEASFEVSQARELLEDQEVRQIYFPWHEPSAETRKRDKAAKKPSVDRGDDGLGVEITAGGKTVKTTLGGLKRVEKHLAGKAKVK
jgi:hypothetical protein